MLSCPNINLPEWQKLIKAVGKTEAVRDYLETDGLIRTPEEVLRKLEARKAGTTDRVKQVKSGVTELFESDPELANAVYEALGFKTKPNIKFENVNNTNLNNVKTAKEVIDILSAYTANSTILEDIVGYYNLKDIKIKYDHLYGHPSGVYNSVNNTISLDKTILNSNLGEFAYIFVHELVHSQYRNMHSSQVTDLLYKLFNIGELTKLGNINYEFSILYDTIKRTISKKDLKSHYGFTNVDEFIAEIYSNKQFQEYLKTIKIESSELTVFDKIIQYLKHLINIQIYGKLTYSGNAFKLAEEISNKYLPLTDIVGSTKNTQPSPEQKQQAQQLYSQYLDTIFPNSEVKDIVYHGTSELFETFDKLKQVSPGFYFTPNSKSAYFGRNDIIYAVILNVKNPISNYKEITEIAEQGTLDAFIEKNYDGIVELQEKEEIIVFEPEQIHILGSKQDVEGFKRFVQKSQAMVELTTAKEGVSKLFESNPKLATYIGTGTVELETIVDADLNINWDALDTMQEEYFKGKNLVSLRNRPERHKGEQFTWDHTQNVVESAKTTPIPHNVDRRTLVLAAMLHDIGKPFRNDDHGADSVRVINDLFADEKQSTLMKLAIRHHMIYGSTTDAQYDAIIADAKDRGVDMADFIELLLALNVADIRRNRSSEEEDEYSGMSITATIAIEIPEKRDKLYAAALRQDAFDDSVMSISPDFEDLASYYQAKEGVDDMPTVEQFRTARASEFANKLTVALGLVFEEVTPEEARALTQNLKTPWNGEPAFFLGGNIYFIQGRMTTDLVFHEFAHPVIRAIAKANPELFAKLFNDLAATKEGQEIIDEVRKAYPELDPNSPSFMEEVLVKSLERRSMDKLKQIQSSPAFMKFIQKFLYHMRQFMRQVFGRNIDVSKVDTDTMLDDLATVLVAGGKIDLNVESVTENDIISFNREAQEKVANDLMNVRNRDIQEVINAYYDTVSKHIKYLKENHNYKELERLLINEFNAGELQKMKKNLHAWQTSIRQMADRFLEEVHDNKKRTNALAATLFRLDDVMVKIYEHVQAIAERPDTQENLHQMYYYMKVVENWQVMIKDLQAVLDDPKNNVPTNSPVNSLVGGIASNIRKIKSVADDVYRAGSVDALYDTLEPMAHGLRESYEKIFDMLERKGAPEAEWNRHYKDYYGMTKVQFDRYEALIKRDKDGSITDKERDELKVLNKLASRGLFLSKDKINYILKGQAGDANWFNSYLEGYLYNTDPVIGGLALYVKNQLSDVMIVAQQKYNDFARDLGDDIRKYRSGLGDIDEGWLGRLTTFVDTTGYTKQDENGVDVYKEVKVRTFINEHKNWRGALAKWEFDLAQAFEKMKDNADASQKVYNDLYVKFKRFQQNYFYQPYTDAYYKRDDVFYKFEGDEVGNKARIFRDEFIEALRAETEPAEGSQMDMMDATRKLDVLWKMYRQKMSKYDIDGNLKTGEEAEIAQRLRDYRDLSRDLYENRLREGAFEEAYFAMIDELSAKGINKFNADGTINDKWVEAMNDWKKVNTRAAIKPEFYDLRDQLLNKIREIMDKLSDEMKAAVDTSEKWDIILGKTSMYKDEDGQNVGTDMSDQTIAEIKALQEQIRWIRKNNLLLTNLTKEETKEYEKLMEKRRVGTHFGVADLERFNKLKDKREVGLSDWDIGTLYQTYQELHDLQNREATSYYVDTVNSWFSQMDMTEFSKYLNGKHEVDASTADLLLESGAPLHLLFDQSPEFQEWFEKNHMNVPPPEYEPKDPEAKVYDYERVYTWSVNRPRSLHMMEHYVVKDPISGHIVDTIVGLPAMKYYNKQVKAEYRTPEIVGVTVDNKKTWLPRSKEVMAKNTRLKEEEKYLFINERYEEVKKDKALLNILEKLKKHHLANQEGSAFSSRLYLDLPRYMRSSLEMYAKLRFRKTDENGEQVSIFTDLMRRIKAFFTVQAELVGDILNYDKGFNLIQTDMFDNELTNIPISGLTHLEEPDVSLNVTMSLMRYMLSAERQKQLVRISPVVRAIQASVSNPEQAIKELKEKDSRNRKSRKLIKLATKGDSVRKKAVDNFIEREFEGKTNEGFTKNIPWINNFVNLLFKRASFSFFAFNIPSALKNSLGMKFQSILEGAGGLYVDQVSLQRGNADAFAAIGELMFTKQGYTRGAKSHAVQLAEAFDISQDRATEPDRWGGQMSRTVVRDIAEGRHWFAFRKAVEHQASLQLSFGMLYKKVVTRTMPDGKVEKIPYKKAFELVDGKLQLKSGIDVRYGLLPTKHVIAGVDTLESIADQYNIKLSEDPVKKQEELEAIFQRADLEKKRLRVRILEIERTNEIKRLTERMDAATSTQEKETFNEKIVNAEKRYEGLIEKAGAVTIENTEFKIMKNRMHQVANNLNGVYASFDQPEAQRYLAFRTISYMRRYFTGLAMDRWGFSGSWKNPNARRNPGMGDAQMGFYTSSMKTLVRTVRRGGKNLAYLTPQEIRALKKLFTELVMLYVLMMLPAWLFGYDDDEEKRNAKLRKLTSPLNLLGVTEPSKKGAQEFSLAGFAQIHALHLLMQIRAEQDQFNPIMSGVKNYLQLVDVKSVALGPTLESLQSVAADIEYAFEGHKKARYERDVGPYYWQDKGQLKVWNHMAKMFGITGTFVDPAMAVANFESAQAKVRR